MPVPYAASTATRMGSMWLSCPVSSKTITAHEIVRVTPAAMAAAPTTAYAPAVIWPSIGVKTLITSPKPRPKAAPMRKTGVKTPHEMGQVTASTVKANLHSVYMTRLASSEGCDQCAVKSKGLAPKRSLTTSSVEERKKPNGKVSIAVPTAASRV